MTQLDRGDVFPLAMSPKNKWPRLTLCSQRLRKGVTGEINSYEYSVSNGGPQMWHCIVLITVYIYLLWGELLIGSYILQNNNINNLGVEFFAVLIVFDLV